MTSQPPPKSEPIFGRELVIVGGFAVAHVVLALAMRVFPLLGFAHALACLGVGVIIAARRKLQEITYVVAYIAGAEVLWRMTGAGIFWEYAKYAICLIVIIGLLRVHRHRNRGLALGYLVMLVPSILLTFVSLDLGLARQRVSFNVSGPLSLTLCVLFFSNVRLSPSEIRRTMLTLLGPVIGIGTIAYYSATRTKDLQFFGDSNAAASGGFGPNQVSAMLGLGLLFALLILFDRKESIKLRIPLLVLGVIFAAQAALTFSRGGLTLGLASAFAAMFYLVRDGRARVTLAIVAVLLFVVGKYLVVPELEVFTAGKLSERYTSIDPSGRGTLAAFDLQIFLDHPLLGVGPGAAPELREELGHAGAAHTEFTRLLAEHGIFGGFAICFLLVLGVRTARGAKNLESRAIVVALLAWVTLFLMVNAMRLAAPSFLFGFACAIAYSSLPLPPRTALGAIRATI